VKENNTAPVNLSISVDDGRYPINVSVGGESFTLYFNPADLFIMRYMKELRELNWPKAETDDSINDFLDKMESGFDGIFGDGAARRVFRYIGVRMELLEALFAKVEEGQKDWTARREAAEKAAKTQAIIDAKKEAAAFSAPE